jgi:hypothetical protein
MHASAGLSKRRIRRSDKEFWLIGEALPVGQMAYPWYWGVSFGAFLSKTLDS